MSFTSGPTIVNGPFDKSWQARLIEGDPHAALLLVSHTVEPLYGYCFAHVKHDAASCQRLVGSTLVHAVRQIESYDPEANDGQIKDWLLEIANDQLRNAGPVADTPPPSEWETQQEESGQIAPLDRQFVYQLQRMVCIEAHRRLEERSPGSSARRYQLSGSDCRITCPECHKVYKINRSRLRERIRCGSCGAWFTADSSVGDPEPPDLATTEARCWYVQQAGAVDGPFTEAELRKLILDSKAPHDALVRKGDDGMWQPAIEALFMPESARPLPADRARESETSEPPRRPRSRPKAQPGDRIGRFEIRQWIGEGAFGDVYRAYDPVLDRELALKVAKAGALEDEKARQFVLSEPKAAGRLRHPNIVAIHDAGFDGKLFYVACDFIPGCTLKERLTNGHLSRQDAVQLVIRLAEALHYAHESGILHRDVKPGNIMVDKDGQALLMDFGLARIEHQGSSVGEAEPGCVGTPGYMSPEQISRDYGEVKAYSDQYSLGVVLYELLCGDPPFSGPREVRELNTLHTTPIRPRDRDSSIAADLEAICLKAMAKRPADRYQTCGQMAEDLKRYAEGRETLARPLHAAQRLVRWWRREPVLASALGFAVAMVLLLIVTLGVNAQKERRAATMFQRQRDQAESARKEAQDARKEALEQKGKAEDNAKAADEQRKIAEEALGKEKAERQRADQARLEAIRNSALERFQLGHQLCESGQVPRGMVYLMESLRLAEDGKSPLASAIRMSLYTWRRELHDLQAVMNHEIDGKVQYVRCAAANGELVVTVSNSLDEESSTVWVWSLKGQT
jgi:hypothetical protein